MKDFRKTLFFLIMLLTLLVLASCNSEYLPVKAYGEPLYKNIVVIGFDGVGGMARNGDLMTDGFREFFSTEGSSIRFDYRCEFPSISAQNWGSYLHGVPPAYHGRTNTSSENSRFTVKNCPSVFQVIHDVYPEARMASICHWIPINYGLIETTAGVYKDPDRPGTDNEYNDEEVRDRVCNYIAENGAPTLMFVHFDSPDGYGHTCGFGSEKYKQAVKNVQQYALDIFDMYDPETTLFIVITDHGGTPSGSHGGLSDAEMEIVFGIRGKGMNVEALDGFDFRPRDLPSIILTAMRIQIPKSMLGECPIGLF
jgi:predicted AlkP superfamily pyrophosphatase or phosphodiesterase